MAFKAFYTQEGVITGLRKVIIASVPNELIVELENKDTFFNKVPHLDFTKAVMKSAMFNTTLHLPLTPTKICP